MSRNLFIAVAALVLVIFALGYWWMSKLTDKPIPSSGTTSSPSTRLAPNSSPNPIPAYPSNVAPSSAPTTPAPDHQAEVEREKKVWDLWLATPIVFYGKVVDTDGNPIANATASISMVDTPGPGEGHTKIQKTSDAQGLFSVSGHGLSLVVQVSKDGYYLTDKSSGNFGYAQAAGKLAVFNDPNAPALFVLKKRGQCEPLILTQGTVKIASDGTPRPMSLTTGHTYVVQNGDIVVQAWIQDQGVPVNSNKSYDWKCKIIVPGGGLQPRTGDPLDFTAPANGYQPSDEIDMPVTATSWSPTASRSYYLQLGNGDYARIDFTIAAENPHQFEITSYLNPQAGHRNLEYDPNQQTNK